MTSRAAGYFEWRDALANARGVSLSLRGAMSIMATYATTESGGDVRPSLARVAARTGLSRSALSRHVADAVALGWLERVQDRSADGKPSVYRLTVPAGLDRVPSGTAGDVLWGDRGVAGRYRGCRRQRHNPFIYP